jgi:GNAT superfamily N-acetyltransferase
MTSVTVRAARFDDATAIAAVRVESWRTTYRGTFPDAYLDGMRIEDSADMWKRVLSVNSKSTSVFVAERNGLVVGFAAGKALEEPRFDADAELAAIYLLPDAQRQGVGKRLLKGVAEAHEAKGASGLLTWVLTGNKPARQFYEQLGAELLTEQSYKWDELELMEAAYGWRDLHALAQACSK